MRLATFDGDRGDRTDARERISRERRPIVQAVILAAGDGGRLMPETAELPKPLLRVGGRPIIHRVLDALAQSGVDEAVIVAGHRGERLRADLPGLLLEVNKPRGHAGGS